MIRIEAPRVSLAVLDKHSHMCDLVYLEGPILSLFRDSKQNWLYLWCDTDSDSTERWLLFPVSRHDLIQYLETKSALLALVEKAHTHWVLDYSQNDREGVDKVQGLRSSYRLLREIKDLAQLKEYMTSADSFFDEELAPDVSLARELNPTLFEVPIDGDWFVNDLDRFSNLYSQLYAFFYCTKPQFITDIGRRIRRFLQSPWQGGYSRINLFVALEKMIPSIHDLKIREMRYSSPGEIKIEALASVGDSINKTVMNFIRAEKSVLYSARGLNAFLSTSKLKRVNLSTKGDSQLNLAQTDIDFVKEKMQSISNDLSIDDELADIASHFPNLIVSSKVLLALVNRVQRLAEFQRTGLLDLEREVAKDPSRTH